MVVLVLVEELATAAAVLGLKNEELLQATPNNDPNSPSTGAEETAP